MSPAKFARDRQTSFAGGEFAPTLWGRTDYERYKSGLKTLHNFIIEPHGVASNRPGTLIVDPTQAGLTLLVAFVFADGTDAVLCAFSDEQVLFYRYPTASLATYTRSNWLLGSAASPYAAADLYGLRFAQIGNVITITHPDYAPYELRRNNTASTSWGLAAIDFTVSELIEKSPYPPGYDLQPAVGEADYLIPMWLPHSIDKPGDYKNPHWSDSPPSDFPRARWRWAVTRVWKDEYGDLHETRPHIVDTINHRNRVLWSNRLFTEFGDETVRPLANLSTWRTTMQREGSDLGGKYQCEPGALVANADYAFGTDTENGLSNGVAIYPDWNQVISLYEHPQFLNRGTGGRPQTAQYSPDYTYPNTDAHVEHSRVYRGVDGIFGYIGETQDNVFVDKGTEPDYSNPPPKGETPFTNGNPRSVVFFQGRRVFGGMSDNPGRLAGSAIDDFANLDEVVPADDADSYKFDLASSKLEKILAMIPRRELIVLTSSGEWVVTGSEGELITPLSMAAHQESEHGCSENVAPIVIGTVAMFLQRNGGIPRALIFSSEGGGYQAIDLSIMSRHLFVGHTIVSWAYAEEPYNILWVVRDDGVLLSLSYSLEQKMMAWSRHSLGGGALVESVATLPEATEDGVYLAIRRDMPMAPGQDTGSSERAIVRMASRVLTDIRDSVFVDLAAKRYALFGDWCVQFSDLSNGNDIDDTIQVFFWDNEDPDTGVLDAGRAVGEVVQVEDPDGGAPGRFELTADLGGNEWQAVLLRPLPTAVYDEALAAIAIPADTQYYRYQYTQCFQSLQGLNHIEGEEVMALVDGDVVGPLTVVAGGVDLGDWAAVAVAGLQYTCELETLEMAQDDKTGKKLVRRAVIEMEGSRGGSMGPTLTGKLTEIRTRAVEHDYGPIPLTRAAVELLLSDKWKESGSVAYTSSDPLPVTILGITRDVEISGW